MVLRDHRGEVIVAACRTLTQCVDATDAELCAIEEGLRLSVHWTDTKSIVETDCAEAVELIKESTPNTSVYAFRISAICELLRERETKIARISRDVNVVGHELARLGRVHARTEVWLRSFPQEIIEAVTMDYNSISA